MEMDKNNDTYADYNYVDDPFISRFIDEMKLIEKEAKRVWYFYIVLAVCIVLSNSILIVSVLVSRKQRRNLQIRLMLNIGCIHCLRGAFWLTQNTVTYKQVVLCNIVSFIEDTLTYMSNVAIMILGVCQCIVIISPRMFDTSPTGIWMPLLVVVPWIVCAFLAVVFRLLSSRSFSQYCIFMTGKITENVWFVLSYGIPLVLILACFISIIIAATCLPAFRESAPPGSHNMMALVGVCLGACFLMRITLYMLSIVPSNCDYSDDVYCYRLKHSIYAIHMTSMFLIPMFNLIPLEMKRFYIKIKSIFCQDAISVPGHENETPQELGESGFP